MKFTKMQLTGQLNAFGAEKFATRIGLSYVIAAIGAACAGIAALVWAVRWW